MASLNLDPTAAKGLKRGRGKRGFSRSESVKVWMIEGDGKKTENGSDSTFTSG